MPRIDPIYIAILIVATIGASSHAFQPEEGYGPALGKWLYQPVCEVPPGRDFGVEYYGLLYRGNTSNLLDKRVLCLGAWEKHILQFLGQTAEALRASGGELVFVDVGANTGLHSLYMSRYTSEIHAFEPYPPVIEKLQANVTQNQLDHVRIHEVGLGDHTQKLPFSAPEKSNQGTGSFVNAAGSLELEIVVGDDYFPAHSIDQVDILKIDVEGFEKPVLNGLKVTISKHRPVIVAEIRVEAGQQHLFTSLAELEATLPEDYRLFSFAAWDATNGFYQLGGLEIDFSTEGWQWDTVAAPEELVELLPRNGQASW